MKRTLSLLLALCMVFLMLPPVAYAAEPVSVDSYEALKAAVEGAAAGADLEITLTADIDMAGTIAVPADATVMITDDGNARALKRTAAGALFDVPAGAALVLRGSSAGSLVLDGMGVSATAAMVTSAGTLELRKATLKGAKNSGTGGAVYVSGGTLKAVESFFEGNSAKTGGAIDTKTKMNLVLTVENCTFTGNTATGNGGAINLLDKNKLTVTGSNFEGNTVTGAAANKGGGALYVANTSASFSGTTFKNNSAAGTDTSAGGAIVFYALGAGANNCSVTDCIFEGNSAPNGGAIALSDSGKTRTNSAKLTWEDNTFQKNTAAVKGGAIAITYDCETMACQVTMNRSTYSENTAPEAADFAYIGEGKGITVDGVALDAPEPEPTTEPTEATEPEVPGEGISTFAALKAAVEGAAAGAAVEITLSGDIDMEGAIAVPADATVVITDDGTARSLNRTAAEAMFDVPAGATLTLRGTAAGKLTLDGKEVAATAAMITTAGSLELTNVTLRNAVNSKTGGAVYVSAGTLTVKGCAFENNAAKTGGAIDTKTKTNLVLTVEDSSFHSNTATTNGGAINLLDTNKLTLSGSTFTGNTVTGAAANKGGGAIYVANTSAAITGSVFKNNSAAGTDTSVGGAIVFYALGASKPSCTVSGCSFEGNSAPNGGALGLSDSGSKVRPGPASVLWENNTFTGNTATTNGGAIAITYDCEDLLGCQVTMNGSTYSGNTAANENDFYYVGIGKGITVDGVELDAPPEEKPSEGPVKVDTFEKLKTLIESAEPGATVEAVLSADIEMAGKITVPVNVKAVITDDETARSLNRTAAEAMFDVPAGATLTLQGTAAGKLTLDGKEVAAIAAMITNAGELVLTDVTLKNAKNSGNGGAVYQTAGTLTATRAVFENNAAKYGGAIDTKTKTKQVLTVADCTFTANTATTNGGAINLMDTNTLSVTDSSFTGNTVTAAAANKGGGALYIANTSATITDSAFKNNSVAGTDTSAGGAIIFYAVGASKTNCTVSGCSFEGNSAPNGGGIGLSDSGKTRSGLGGQLWENNTFTNNTAAINGGGIAITYDCETMSCQVNLKNTIYSGNTAANENDFYYVGTGKGICVDGVYLDPTEAETYVFSEFSRVGLVPDVSLSDDIFAQALAGMALVDNYAYSVKLKGNPKPSGDTTNYHLNEPSTIFRTDITTGETVRMTPTDGTGYVPYMHHANGVSGTTINGETYLFVATLVSGKQAVVKVRVDGTTFTKVGEYEVLEEGASVSKSGIDILSVDGEKTVLLLKTGAWFYTAEVPHTQVDGSITVTKRFTVDMSAVTIGDATENASQDNGYTWQDCGYKCGVLYVPVTTKNYTVVGVFRIFNEDGTMKEGLLSPVPGKSLRVGGGECRSVEIESLAVGNDGKLYFNANCYALDGEVNFDGVFRMTNPVAPHVWQWQVVTPATTGAEGLEQQVCAVCGEKGETRAIPKLEPVAYEITQGAGQTVTQGEDAAFTSNADFAKFAKVQVDGKDLDAAHYTVAQGSTVVTLKGSFVETLSVGSHTLTVVAHDGQAETTFTVEAPATSAPTEETDATEPTTEATEATTEPSETVKPTQPGDSSNAPTGDTAAPVLWLAMLAMTASAAAALVMARRKREF